MSKTNVYSILNYGKGERVESPLFTCEGEDKAVSRCLAAGTPTLSEYFDKKAYSNVLEVWPSDSEEYLGLFYSFPSFCVL